MKMDLREVGCENLRWVKLAHDRVQWQAFVLEVLNLRFFFLTVSESALRRCVHIAAYRIISAICSLIGGYQRS
jgi:hypothetical protein